MVKTKETSVRGNNRNISALCGSEINTSNDKSLRTQELVFASNRYIVEELCLEDGWKKKFESSLLKDPLIVTINERKLKEGRMCKGKTFKMIIISDFFFFFFRQTDVVSQQCKKDSQKSLSSKRDFTR